MFSYIDKKLNNVTMYRLVLFYLRFLLVCALVLGYFRILPYSPIVLTISFLYLSLVSWLVNTFFAWMMKVETNVESYSISALILVFIIAPPQQFFDLNYFSIAGLCAFLAMASKYIFAVRKKHIFNPVAISVVLVTIIFGQSTSWWVGNNAWMLAPVLLGGLLIAKKLRRAHLILAFLVAVLTGVLISSLHNVGLLLLIINGLVLSSPLLFFAFVMLTEPLTTPPTKTLQICYGATVGLLFSPLAHFGSFSFTPELALVVGNIFSYVVSPKERIYLTLKEVTKIAKETYDFVFLSKRRIVFNSGEYLEWTVPKEDSDTRGNRRYFTIASSPTEDTVRIGVKFYPNPSSFKKKLFNLKVGSVICAGARAGDFILPKKVGKRMVFIAGGIGITPFRSMLKYLIDTDEKRDIVLFYLNRTLEDIAYKEILYEAEKKLKIKTVYTLTDIVPATWSGEKGSVNSEMIKKYVPDYQERVFYLSGPHSMVVAFEKLLLSIGVKKSMIKKDFFPGYA